MTGEGSRDQQVGCRPSRAGNRDSRGRRRRGFGGDTRPFVLKAAAEHFKWYVATLRKADEQSFIRENFEAIGESGVANYLLQGVAS